MFVNLELDGAFAARNFNGDDLGFEAAFGDGADGTVLGFEGVFVLGLAGDGFLGGDVFGGDALTE